VKTTFLVEVWRIERITLRAILFDGLVEIAKKKG